MNTEKQHEKEIVKREHDQIVIGHEDKPPKNDALQELKKEAQELSAELTANQTKTSKEN